MTYIHFKTLEKVSCMLLSILRVIFFENFTPITNFLTLSITKKINITFKAFYVLESFKYITRSSNV